MSKEISHDRRRFLGTAVMTLAAAELSMIGAAKAQSSQTKPADLPTIKPAEWCCLEDPRLTPRG